MNKLKSLTPAKLAPYVAAIVLFLLLSIIYVNPVLQGKQLMQSDIVNWKGMAQEIIEFRENTGEEALWTNSIFGGMPAYQISVQWANNVSGFFHDVMTLWLPRPADMIFLYFIGFFIFLLLLKINPWIALAGAVGFALTSYNFIVIEAGHNSKAVAIGYMAPVMGAVIYTFRGYLLGGGLLFALFMALQLFANHFQITYYLGIIVVIYGLFELYRHIKEQRLTGFLQKLGVLVAALVVAIGVNIGNFWGTYTYTSETMRGGTELTIREEPVTEGLDKDYITNWSYGLEETFTLLVPNAKGGASGVLGENDRAMEGIDPNYQRIISQESHYWGSQPFTSGPVYAGAVVLFFFILALHYLKGPIKWSFLIAIILSVMLAWGKHFIPLTDFFIDYVPGYDKFRAVAMTLVIASMCIPALAFLGLYKIYKEPDKLSFKSAPFITAFSLTAGLSLLFYLLPRAFFSFISPMEAQGYADMAAREPQMEAQINEMLQQLKTARVAIFQADAIRSFFFATAAAIVTLLFANNKIGRPVFILLVVVLITIDMWPVNRRYLNDDDFEQQRRVERPFTLRTADQHILEDPDEFRVLDLTENTFNSTRASYYHHSIGGYHGAKMQRYQDLIDFHIEDEMMSLTQAMQEGSMAPIHRRLNDLNVLNMLNTRYIIYHPDNEPIHNPHALGNAWFVNNYRIVENADEEILELEEIDPAEEALIDKRFASQLEGVSLQTDPGASIDLVDYQPNELTYEYSANSEQLALFSEVYYPEGWEVYINGREAEHFRANYILRGMILPEGDHTIEFRFRPDSYYTGRYIALFFSIVLVTGIIAYALIQARKIFRDQQKDDQKKEAQS
ncbi:MAG: YfhO family protein [Bacteroidales bacterium]